MFKATARIVFDPLPLSGGPQMFKPFWVIVVVDGYDGKDLGDYYRYLLEKRFGMHVQTSYTPQGETVERKHFGLKLQLPAWGTHISVVRGEPIDKKKWEHYKELYNNKLVEFEYDISPRTSGKHWWLRVNCQELLDLRELMGYKRDPKYTLHFTLGSPHPLFEEKSEYLHSLYLKGFIPAEN